MRRIVAIIIFLFLSTISHAKPISTIFGVIEEDNPAILELIDSKAMQRLKHIDQSGPDAYYTKDFPTFSRFEHSLGVYALLKKFNAPTNEQIAGLLHDTSHTVFSHLGDIIFQSGEDRTKSYQDDIHNWFLSKMQVDKILAKYNLKLDDISPKNPKFKALEQSYPDMNADRIEYNLHTGLVFSDLSSNDVNEILASLKFKNGKWYFANLNCAKKFAKLSNYYTKNFWGCGHNVAMYTVMSAVIKKALEQNIIKKEDFFFGVDSEVIKKLNNTKNKEIKDLLAIAKNLENYYDVTDKSSFDIFQPVKMRGINPLVWYKDELQRLSDISPDFANEVDNTKKYTNHGVYIKFKNIQDPSLYKLLISSNN